MRLQIDPDTRLRSVEPTDAEALFLVIDGHRDHLRRWLPWVDRTYSAADTLAFIALSRENEADGSGLAALIEARDQLCGVIGLDAIDPANRSSEIGYWLREDCQGRGLATRAAAALIEYAFARLRLNRVAIRAACENRRSRAVAERLGFREEGVLREAERRGDRFVDVVVYSLLRRDGVAKSALGVPSRPR